MSKRCKRNKNKIWEQKITSKNLDNFSTLLTPQFVGLTKKVVCEIFSTVNPLKKTTKNISFASLKGSKFFLL